MSLGKSILWVFCLGSGPVFGVFGLLFFCFAVSSGETQVWLGDLRVVVVGGLFVVLFVVSFDLPAQYAPMMSLYKRLFDSLCSCKDRAFSATSAKLEEKKTPVATRRCRCLLRSARV